MDFNCEKSSKFSRNIAGTLRWPAVPVDVSRVWRHWLLRHKDSAVVHRELSFNNR